MTAGIPLSSSGNCSVCTRSGTPIPTLEAWEVERTLQNSLYSDIDRWTAIYQNRLTGIQVRSKPHHRYNCVGLVFASRRVWIETTPHIETFLREDGYTRLRSAEELQPGDIVLYEFMRELAHVAMFFRAENLGGVTNYIVISKWGQLPEFIHPMDQVPEFCGTPTAFYTDRINA